MKIGIITARGGSKRIPLKNIKTFAGKPMIAWPLAAAQAAKIFDHIVVSTDSEEIAEIARGYGAEVPFMRPDHLADDHTPTAPVFLHAIQETEKFFGEACTWACCIYPTSPFIRAHDLSKSFQILHQSNAPALLSVTSFPFPPMRALHVGADNAVSFQWPEHAHTRSQDLPELCHDAGQFYWVRTKDFYAEKCLIMKGTLPYMLPRKRVQDIDTQEDWENAEVMATAILASQINEDI